VNAEREVRIHETAKAIVYIFMFNKYICDCYSLNYAVYERPISYFPSSKMTRRKKFCSITRTKFNSMNRRNYIFGPESKGPFVDNLARPDFWNITSTTPPSTS
jgi:hypothetical protein